MIKLTEEHIREICTSHANVRVRAVRPPLFEIHTIYVKKTHVLHATCDSIETCRQSNEIELSQHAILCHNTLLGDLFHRVVLDINDIILWSVHCFVEVLLERWTLSAPRVRCLERSHHITLAWVGNSLSGLFHPELVCLVVGLSVEEIVLVCGKPEFEATL